MFVDPFLKALNRITGCLFKLEQSVNMSEFMMLNELTDLKELQEQVSKRSVSDTVLYHIKLGRYTKVIVIEVKTDKSISQDSIAQAIGYHIACQTPDKFVQMYISK